jgi:PDZ domain-containing protein
MDGGKIPAEFTLIIIFTSLSTWTQMIHRRGNRTRRHGFFVVFIFIAMIGFALQPTLPGQSPAPATQENTAPARFAYGGNAASNPAAFIGDLIFLPVKIDQGKPLLFELNSSASATSVDPGDAPNPSRSAGTSQPAMRNCVLGLPGVALPMSVLPVAGKSDFGLQMGMPYHGTLGADFFDRLVVVVNYLRQTVQLYDPATFAYSGPGKSFPLTFAGTAPLIRAKFELSGHKSLEANFVVNTALDTAIVFSSAYTEAQGFSSVHFKTVSSSYPELDGGAKIFLGRLKMFQLGPYVVEQPVAAFSQSRPDKGSDQTRAGAIGAGFLRRFTVVFDLAHQRIILEPNLEFNKFAEEDMSGLAIVAQGANLRTFEIVRVQPGTPAAAAGIHEGDIIAGIDSEPAADLTLHAVRDLFRQVGHKYKLLIERNGKTQEVVIEMKRLV